MRISLPGIKITDLRRAAGGGGTYEEDVFMTPTGAGDIQQMTAFGSGSSNWGRMADGSDATGVLIAGFDPGSGEDRYALENLPGDAIDVLNVNATVKARKDDAGLLDTFIQYSMKLGATVQRGAQKTVLEVDPPDPYGFYTWNGVSRPGGGGWTVSDINSLLFGQRTPQVSFDTTLRMSRCYLWVKITRPL